jgi:hypothetical protein
MPRAITRSKTLVHPGSRTHTVGHAACEPSPPDSALSQVRIGRIAFFRTTGASDEWSDVMMITKPWTPVQRASSSRRRGDGRHSRRVRFRCPSHNETRRRKRAAHDGLKLVPAYDGWHARYGAHSSHAKLASRARASHRGRVLDGLCAQPAQQSVSPSGDEPWGHDHDLLDRGVTRST